MLANTDTILADANFAIGYPMQSVVYVHIGIELLDIDWQKYAADGKNDRR
jgi:hypothetical protein